MQDSIENCLYVTAQGELLQLFCQYQVICINDVHKLKKGDLLWVEAVLMARDGQVVYQIEGEYYYHSHFAVYQLS